MFDFDACGNCWWKLENFVKFNPELLKQYELRLKAKILLIRFQPKPNPKMVTLRFEVNNTLSA